METASKQRLYKHVPAETNTRAAIEERCFLLSPSRGCIARTPGRLSAVQLSVVSWKSACKEKTRSLVWNGRQPEAQLVEGWLFSWEKRNEIVGWLVSSVEVWQLSRPLQGRLRRDGAIVELTVDKSSVAGYSSDSNDVIAGSWRISTVGSRC
jgi:hypothetical protein